MFTWAKVLLMALQLVRSLVQWVRERKLVNKANKELMLELDRAANGLAHEIKKTRNDIRTRLDAVPDGEQLPNDGYRRD